jgi:DNA-binding FadR family transcriptional regulator
MSAIDNESNEMTMPTQSDDDTAVSRKRSTPLTDRVYAVLYARITSGEFSPEQRLPSEHDLASEFRVSRPVIREALERLRTSDLIYSRQGAGSFVRAQKSPPRPGPALGFWPVETIADIQRCFEFRLTIEPEAASLAALRHNDAALAKLGAAVEAMERAKEDRQHRSEIDFAFHLAVAEASNNHYYVASMLALKEHITIGLKMHGATSTLAGPRRLKSVLEELTGIFVAIRDRDRDAAQAQMYQHIAGSRDRLFEGRLLNLALTD